ncbi:glycosyltransferase [Aureimonas populi]|uniref:Glycosyltransferase n=1 Tax=Aureimonas populi TaxID=1701758 RepID=A0ABW5CPT5_9HYPH|nr:glycosyltransferase [Aureimonas populi]
MSMAAAPDRSVTIAICTFRRDHIARTLASLAGLDVPQDVAVDVVVADNDTVPSAQERVERASQGLPFPVSYVHAPASNISIARNACLDRATGRYLAFLDDDEVVARQWLAALLDRAAEGGADAVLGPVEAVYGPQAPGWMRDGDFHSSAPVFVKGEILTGYTCNVLIDRRSAAVEGLRFDLARGRSGGEDTAFFRALTLRAGRIDYAPEALVREDVPEGRASFGWLARRRLRMGQTHGQLLAETHRAGAARAKAAGVAAAKVAACGLLALRHAFSPVERRRSVLRGILHAGAIGGLFGMRALTQYGGQADARPGGAHAA